MLRRTYKRTIIGLGVGMRSSWRKTIVRVVVSAIVFTICRNMILMGIHTTIVPREVIYQAIIIDNVTKMGVGVNISSVPVIKVGAGVNALSVKGIKEGTRRNAFSVPGKKIINNICEHCGAPFNTRSAMRVHCKAIHQKAFPYK